MKSPQQFPYSAWFIYNVWATPSCPSSPSPHPSATIQLLFHNPLCFHGKCFLGQSRPQRNCINTKNFRKKKFIYFHFHFFYFDHPKFPLVFGKEWLQLQSKQCIQRSLTQAFPLFVGVKMISFGTCKYPPCYQPCNPFFLPFCSSLNPRMMINMVRSSAFWSTHWFYPQTFYHLT